MFKLYNCSLLLFCSVLKERDGRLVWYSSWSILLFWTFSLFMKLYHPLYSGCKLNVQKTFRRRPAHLLNVFCTSVLHAVSTGQISHIITPTPPPPPTPIPHLAFTFQISLLLLSEFKGSLSGLRQYLTTGRPLKMMKNAFYYGLKTLFCHVGRQEH